MKLRYVNFFNFKTYRGNVILGPLVDLNGIIGGNGSGKSNIIDGIMFALNADNDKLRVSRMDYLVHGSNTGTPLSNNCSVELEFWENGAKSLALKRKLFYNFNNKKSWSEYELNGENITLDNYTLELGKLNLSNGLNNIVVGQGDIGFIIQMSPQQITTYLEELAGSGEIVQKYKSLEQELETFESHLKVLSKSKKDSLDERRIMEILEVKERRQNSMNTDLKENTKKKIYLETFKFLSDLSSAKKQLALCEKDIDEKNRKIQETEEKIGNYDGKRQQLVDDKKTNHSNLLEQKKHLYRKTNELCEIENKNKTKNKWVKENLKRQEKYKIEEKKIKERINKIDIQISEHDHELENARNTYQCILEKDMQRIAMTEEFKDLDSLYKARNNFLEFSIENKKHCLEQLENQEKVNSSELEKVLNKKSTFQYRIKTLDDDIKIFEDEKKALESKFDEYKTNQEKLFLNSTRIAHDIKEIESKVQQIKVEIAKKDSLKKVRVNDLKAKEIVKKLKNGFGSSVLGRIEDLVKCKDVLYNDLFYSFIFNMRNTVVVKDFNSVVNCINFINQNNIERTNILPLDSLPIPEDVIGTSSIYTSGNYKPLKPLVVSTVEGTGGLIDYVCNNILFCDDIDIAISLKKDSRFEKCKIVVSDGTIFYKSRIQLNAISLNILNEVDNYNEKIIEFKNSEQLLTSTKEKECEINIKFNEIESKIKNIEVDVKTRNNILTEKLLEKTKSLNVLKCIELEESILENNIYENDQNLKKLKEELGILINSKKLLRDSIFHDFVKKYNVKSLDSQDYLSTAPDFLKAINKIQNKINCLKEEKNALGVSSYSQQLSLFEIEFEGVTKEIQVLKNNMKELLKSKTTIKNNIENYEASIEKIDTELKTINKSIKELNHYLEILRADSTKTIQSLKFQIIDIQRKISAIVKEYTYIIIDENFNIESFDKSYLVETYGTLFEESLDDLLNQATEIEESLIAELARLDFSEAHKLQYESLKEKFLFLDSEFNEVKIKKNKCLELFKEIKVERKRKFEKLYNLLNEKMEEFMHKLFRSFDCSFYIQCSITSTEPYLEGTRIYCQLPGKQLRELSQLSTGEKKIVSLSMILACHRISSSPFLIFDEVDANMDHERLKYLVSTLRSLQNDVQFIIVSHIEEVFNQCDMIFGTVDNQNNKMQVTDILIVDMRKFD